MDFPLCPAMAASSQSLPTLLIQAGPLESILPDRAQVTILTGPMPPELPAALRAMDPGIEATDGRVILRSEAILRKPDVLRRLLELGVDIRQLGETQATLEEVYLEATGG